MGTRADFSNGVVALDPSWRYFRRDGSGRSFRVKLAALSGIAAFEARRWRITEYVRAYWEKLPVLLADLLVRGGVGHTVSPFPRGGLLELKVARSDDDRFYANVGEEKLDWRFDWLEEPPKALLNEPLAASIMRCWTRGAELNAAKANFDFVLDCLITECPAWPVLPGGGVIRLGTLYQLVFNGRSYWYRGEWLIAGHNRLVRVAWPDEAIERLDL